MTAGVLDRRVEELEARAGDRSGTALLQMLIDGPLAGRIALVSSFGSESAVLLHMVARIDPGLPVIFLQTGKHFSQTLGYRDALVDRLGLRDVRSVMPDQADLDLHDPDGALWQREPDMCCHIRKTDPLALALAPFEAWITGRKRFQGGARLSLPTIESDPVTARLKINPLAPWAPDDVQRYLSEHDMPAHPLVEEGYPSIGCAPCTERVKPGEGARAGRWAWLDKSECGIHV